MVPFAEDAQAFLLAGGSGCPELLPADRIGKQAVLSLLRLERSGEHGVLVAPSGHRVVARPGGLRLSRHPNPPRLAHWHVADRGDGTVVLSLGGAFLRADAESRLVAAGPEASALRFRLLGPREAFRRAESRIVGKHGAPQPNGRFLRVPLRETPGDADVLRDARVIALDWLALMPGRARRDAPADHNRIRVWRGTIAYPMPESGWIATACLLGGSPNYYHHLVDYMLNWFDLRDRVDAAVPVLTLPPAQRFQAEILDAFGLMARVRPVAPLGAVRVRRLIVPRPAVVGTGEVRDRAIIEACRAFLDTRIAPRPDAPRRIFVSRAMASRRRASNESAAIAIAARHGFAPVVLEGMGFLDQVALFRRAEAVAGLHGAGFANLVFAPPGCRVIEILPSEPLRHGYFANLAAGLGLRFERVAARGAFHADDLEIDLAGLRAALERGVAG
ncbi:glycosyltransferase family 61 protein [Falsiroseomonas sp. HW251]|uniref:glycosyltransferase family 61 protein n=1 Tax=Falsiroseomonas sp. HW251 TaxID=3390998 RepID=UPI003D31C660